MNYLAHLYLSGENDLLKVGNFIGDYVKGKQYLQYEDGIKQGIILHRQIDSYTDQHKNTKEASLLFKPGYGRYSGIVIDIIYDHFLAVNWNKYSNLSLQDFSKQTYAVLLSNFNILPKRVKMFLPFIIQQKRLESYATFEGLHEALSIMARRTSLPDEADYALQVLNANYQTINTLFDYFFIDLRQYIEDNFEVVIKKPA